MKVICFNCNQEYMHQPELHDEYQTISDCPKCGALNLILDENEEN